MLPGAQPPRFLLRQVQLQNIHEGRPPSHVLQTGLVPHAGTVPLCLDYSPFQAAADIQFCAAQGHDHTECCMRNGVATTLAGSKCLTFCDQRPGNVTQLDLTYIACYDRFENMKSCFWQDATTRLSNSFSQDEAPASLPQARRLSSARTFQTFN